MSTPKEIAREIAHNQVAMSGACHFDAPRFPTRKHSDYCNQHTQAIVAALIKYGNARVKGAAGIADKHAWKPQSEFADEEAEMIAKEIRALLKEQGLE